MDSGNTIYGLSQQMKFGFTGGDLQTDMKRYGAFGRFDYDLTDSIHAYVNAAGVIKKNEQYQAAPMLANVTISRDNAFLAPAYRAALVAAGQTTFRMSEFMAGNGERRPRRFNPAEPFRRASGCAALQRGDLMRGGGAWVGYSTVTLFARLRG